VSNASEPPHPSTPEPGTSAAGPNAPTRRQVLKPEKQDYSVNTTRPFTLWPDGTPAPQLLELQQERMTERNEQCESLNLLPDPCAGTRGARSDVWKVSRNEKILETVVDSENIDLFLSIIAKSLKIPVVYLPRLTLTIQGEHVDISNYGLGEFQRQAKLIKEGEFGIGIVSHHRKDSRHRMILIIRNTEEARECYIIDSKGLKNPAKSESVRNSLKQLLPDDKEMTLQTFDTHDVNFRPAKETIEFLKERFKLEVSRPNKAFCRHFALFYAIEILSIGRLANANHLTNFLYVDLLRRTQIPPSEPLPPPPSSDTSPTLVPPVLTAALSVPPETSSAIHATKEQAELMLYARALAYGIFKHVKNVLKKTETNDIDFEIDHIDLDVETFTVSREKDIDQQLRAEMGDVALQSQF
jgi:hypothetical protein